MRKGWWLGSIAAVFVLAGSALAVSAPPPTYELWNGGRYVAAGTDLAGLERALRVEGERLRSHTLTLQAGGQQWVYKLADLGLEVDSQQTLADVRAAAAAVPWWRHLPGARLPLSVAVSTRWDQARLETALEPVRSAVTRAPKAAELKLVNRQPVILPETAGTALDTAALVRRLQSADGEENVAVPLLQVEPAVTKASLEAMRINRVIAAWTTEYDPKIPRAENVERAAQAFDGLILKPGEILSYNGTVGPVSAETGWREAFVIENGKLVRGVGGGVCQVATTFYGAALRANLEIMERHPHQLAVWYIAPSQDAAITPGVEDLKLRNTLPGHILIQTEASGGKVTFRIYGEAPVGQEVRIESRVIGSQPFETQYTVDPQLKPGQRVVLQNGNQGLTSEAYRVVYQDGKEVRRELLSRDVYLPTAQIIAVPTTGN